MSVEALSSGEGLSGACLPLTWPCLSLFLLLLLFYTFVWKTAGFLSLLALLGCAAEHSTFSVGRAFPSCACEFSHLVETFCLLCLLMRPPRCLCTRSTWQHPKSQLGSCTAQTRHGVPATSWCLVWGSAEGQKCKDKEYSQAWDLDGARSCGHSTAAFNGEWL